MVFGLLAIGFVINHPYLTVTVGSLVLVIYFFEKWSTRQAIRNSGIEQINLMGGTQFEERLAVLFTDLGF